MEPVKGKFNENIYWMDDFGTLLPDEAHNMLINLWQVYQLLIALFSFYRQFDIRKMLYPNTLYASVFLLM